ncbi:type VI secretion system-associated protein TagO [Granulosicoccaceae sp. 1_MG-2023]|nr:type VI secretion system-associated protein TagO [Granulosicoccaceae sp. 1_MG-2023]
MMANHASLYISCAFFAVSSNVFAAIENDLSRCAQTDGALARLECYDQLAKKHELNKPQPASGDDGSSIGAWETTHKVNPIDDTETVVLTQSSSSERTRYGRAPTLVIRCKSNKTEMYVNWADYLGSKARVLERLDKETAQTSAWSLSTDHRATFYPGSPIRRLKQMADGSTYVLQVTPYNESPVTAIFDMNALSEALTPLRKACNW